MRACPILRHLETTRNAIERGLRGRLPLRLSSLAMPRWKVSVLWVGVGLEGGSRGIPGEREVTQEEVLGRTWSGVGRG